MVGRKILDKMKKDYRKVYEWKDKPGEIYERHKHPYETKLTILGGGIEINDKKLKRGDSIIIKTREYHNAVVGPRGCKYLVGEQRR